MKKCPYCDSSKIKEKLYKVAVGPGSNGKYPKEEEYIKYKCLDCGKEFYEDDLKQ